MECWDQNLKNFTSDGLSPVPVLERNKFRRWEWKVFQGCGSSVVERGLRSPRPHKCQENYGGDRHQPQAVHLRSNSLLGHCAAKLKHKRQRIAR